MHKSFYTLLLTIPLLAACQSGARLADGAAPGERLQGQLRHSASGWQLTTCSGQQLSGLRPDQRAAEQLQLLDGQQGGLFADLQLYNGRISLFYRLQPGGEGHGCDDPALHNTSLRASGNEPFWGLYLGADGMLLTQPGVPPLALPYVEELLPDGSIHVSARQEAEHVQVWIRPQNCIDSMSGALHHMSVTLDWNGHNFNGCAHYGAQRQGSAE